MGGRLAVERRLRRVRPWCTYRVIAVSRIEPGVDRARAARVRSPGAGRAARSGNSALREGAALAEDRGAVSWRKSSYSSTAEQCCEMAVASGEILVRDSKCPGRMVLVFTPDAWRTALAWMSRPLPDQAAP
ncbi:DUF397 domain-containing protein [Streptomyces sp. NPDC006237]|uniref:DUF397 domain-containing protein n=1 Tax=unclassified Streptomyces TaxID=2593676 RepID=UPI0033A4BE86